MPSRVLRVLFGVVIVLLATDLGTTCAQSPLDGFDPNANGTVRAVVVQADGKILLGGDFTTLAPNGGPVVAREHIARLNRDGTIDTAFDPRGSDDVWAIAVQSDGKILVGGSFTFIGTQPRNRIARLDPISGAADSFDPNGSGRVNAIAIQADGKILAGGVFTSIGGQTRNRLARLDPTTGLADSLNPNANGLIQAMALQADGKILVGGTFTSVGGQTRNRIARLDPANGLADSFNPNANAAVLSLAVQADGKILAGGEFVGPSSIGGQTRNHIARLDRATGLADSFNPNANADVFSITVQPDGRILVGGSFALANSIGGATRSHIARLDPITGLADPFNPSANNDVRAIALQEDGKILVGGDYSGANGIGGATRNRIARLERDGSAEQTFTDLNIVGGHIDATAVQPDGKVLIGGSFDSVLGVTRNNIARLNTNGTLDTAFNPNANFSVLSIALQTDGKILTGGNFNTMGGQTRNHIARLHPDGTIDSSFDPNANDQIYSIAVQADGKILTGGYFDGANSIGGQARNRIARLDPVTGLADSFNPNANNIVFCIVPQPDGKLLVSGQFTNIGGATRNRIARLDPTSGLADSFNPNANNWIQAMAVQADGKIVVSGLFTGVGGQTRNHIARLEGTTGLADSFNPNANDNVLTLTVQADGKILAGGEFNGTIGGQPRNYIARFDPATGLADSFNPSADFWVRSIALQVDGKVMAGGDFANIGGQPRSLFARLTNDTVAGQNLAVSSNTVTWTRSGSSPQFTRVAFESSTDNVNFTSLGVATPSGSNWTLTGLNLPTGQNLFIRARGFYHTGYQNDSESIAEIVRNVFLPFHLTGAVSRKTHGAAGNFDIPLPLSGEPGVECRSSGLAHTLVFTFNNNVISGNASVTSGTGTVSGSPIFASNTMTVNLTGVADVQKITVTLSGVTNASAQVLPNTAVSVNMLIGDINGSKTVSASDIGEVKARAGTPIDVTSFRADVVVNNAINASDIGLVKSRSGFAVP